MALNDTPSGERVAIGFFGRRNVGKSSLVNAVTGQALSVVSPQKGTTTDPVQKAMELLPLGPVMMFDTPGLDDEGELGELRVEATRRILRKVDIAIIVADAKDGMTTFEKDLAELIRLYEIEPIIVYNKCDLVEKTFFTKNTDAIYVSAKENINIYELKERIAASAPKMPEKKILDGLVEKGDNILLITPIDAAAPKGRLILPQQQVLREILDCDATAIVVKETSVFNTIENMKMKPKLVITDSNVFGVVSMILPQAMPLTSFSILFAKYKGDLEQNIEGISAIKNLQDGDRVLICEGCTHHRQCDDIGTVKIPAKLKDYTGKDVKCRFTSGGEFPSDLAEYKLIIHCGGCMLNRREMKYRLAQARKQGVSFTNYGIFLAYVQGILNRSLEVFPEVKSLLQK